MSQKIIRIGSSLGVTIPKTMLEKINTNLGDQVSLNYNQQTNSLEVKKIESELDEQTMEQAIKLIDKYKSELKKIK